MRPLALLVAWFSLGQLLIAVVLLGPHSDAPGQPVVSLLVIAAAIAGFVLAGGLWRRRAAIGRHLPAWGVGVALCVLLLTLVVASPTERREAWGPLAIGLALWFAVIGLATRHVRRAAPKPAALSSEAHVGVNGRHTHH